MCPQFHSPLFLIVSFARIYKTVTAIQYVSGRPCENSLQRRRVEAVKIFIRKYYECYGCSYGI